METNSTIFSKISNTIFLISSIFMLCFFWCNFYLKNLTHSIFSSLVITSCFCLIYFITRHHVNIKAKTKKTLRLNKEYFINQLTFGKANNIQNYIIKLYQITNYKIISAYHIIENSQNIDIFINFNENINQEKIIQLIQNSKNTIIDIYCSSHDKTIITPDLYQLNFYTVDDIFKKSQIENIPLDLSINIKKSNKLSLKTILCTVLSKSKSKNYFLLSLLLLFSSLFTPYNVYYIICSTILILLSIYSRFNKKFN